MCFRNATLCLNERQLMLQGHFHPILLIVSRHQRCPLVQHVLFPKGGWDALSKRSRISWNVRRAGSGHLIFLKLSALSSSVLHTPALSPPLEDRTLVVLWLWFLGVARFHGDTSPFILQFASASSRPWFSFSDWEFAFPSFLPNFLPPSLPSFLFLSAFLPSLLPSFLPLFFLFH